MGRDEGVVVAGEQEHVAVSEVNVGLLHFEGYGHVDEWEIADLDLILEIESARGRHIGISVILSEVTHRDAGIQSGRFMEDGLGITDFQMTQEQRQMHDRLIARLLQAGKPFKFKTPELLVEAEISLSNAENTFKLCRASIDAEINHVGDSGLLNTDAIALIVVFQVESQVGSSLEVVFPAEMVGGVFLLKPVGGLPLELHIKSGKTEILVARSEKLFPLPFDVEIPDLVAQSDEVSVTRDARRLEQVDDDAAVHAELVVIAREYRFAFQIVEMLYRVKAMCEACIEVEGDVVIVFLVS